MSGDSIELRIRHPKGSSITSNLFERSCIFDLKREISKLCGIPASNVALKFGYPPLRMDLPDNTTLENVGIISGETIIAEEDQSQPQSSNPISHSTSNNNAPQRTGLGGMSTGPKTGLGSVSTGPQKTTASVPKTQGTDQIPDPDGLIMIRRVIAADNSCLFNSIAYALENKAKNKSRELRRTVASYIMNDPQQYNEAVLERTNDQYCSWILKDESWGGAIELEVFSKHYKVEIGAVDIENLIINVFGTGQGYNQRIYVLYDGIHYDILARNISEDMDVDMDITIFSPQDKYAYEGALALAKELNSKKQFTNMGKFSIQCGTCYEKFVGESEAVEHNKKTGHINFQECK